MADVMRGIDMPTNSSQRRQHVLQFMDTSRAKGEEAFGDSADNLTGIVIFFKR